MQLFLLKWTTWLRGSSLQDQQDWDKITYRWIWQLLKIDLELMVLWTKVCHCSKAIGHPNLHSKILRKIECCFKTLLCRLLGFIMIQRSHDNFWKILFTVNLRINFKANPWERVIAQLRRKYQGTLTGSLEDCPLLRVAKKWKLLQT